MASLESEVARALETPRPFYESIVSIVQAHIGLVERSPAAVSCLACSTDPRRASRRQISSRSRRAKGSRASSSAASIRVSSCALASFLVEQLGNLITPICFKGRLAERPREANAASVPCRSTWPSSISFSAPVTFQANLIPNPNRTIIHALARVRKECLSGGVCGHSERVSTTNANEAAGFVDDAKRMVRMVCSRWVHVRFREMPFVSWCRAESCDTGCVRARSTVARRYWRHSF